jgi:hypothetical protein
MEQTGPNEGHIAIESSTATGAEYDLKDIKADPDSLNLTCEVNALFSADIVLSIKRSSEGQLPITTIVVSHALIGSGTYVYPIRPTEDQQVHDFLIQAAFPSLT